MKKFEKNNLAKKLFVFGAIALAICGLFVFSVATVVNDASDVPASSFSAHSGIAKFCTSNDVGCDCPVDTDPSCGP